MSCGFRQAIHIGRKALLLWAWRGVFAHKTILHQFVFVYNTVVLGAPEFQPMVQAFTAQQQSGKQQMCSDLGTYNCSVKEKVRRAALPPPCIARRRLLHTLCGLTSAAAVSFCEPFRSRVGAEEAALPVAGDILVFAGGENRGRAITPDAVMLEAPPVLALAKDPATGYIRQASQKGLILALRMNRTDLTPESQTRSADGVLAFSAVCTHLGCIIEDWDPARKFLRCPCHKGTYDPRQHGKVISGPPPRSLPVLPLKLQNGTIVAADSFTARVGP
jgi:rieske iron-sulfur protein